MDLNLLKVAKHLRLSSLPAIGLILSFGYTQTLLSSRVIRSLRGAFKPRKSISPFHRISVPTNLMIKFLALKLLAKIQLGDGSMVQPGFRHSREVLSWIGLQRAVVRGLTVGFFLTALLAYIVQNLQTQGLCYLKILSVNPMNIEKIVSDCLSRRRSQSSANPKPTKIVKVIEMDTNCSFQPRISELPHSIYQPSNKTECSRQQILERLHADRRALENKRAEEKFREEEQKYQQNCTFQPDINPNSKKILKTECTEADPFQRLYTDALTKKKLSESLQSLQVRQCNKENYPYQPQTNYRSVLNSQTCNMKPIYERIEEIVKEKRERMKSLQENAKKQQLQAQPSINEVSEKIVAAKEEFKKSVLQRISGYIEDKRKKQVQAAKLYEEKLLKQCTFKPEINNAIEVSTNFQTRQQEFMRRAEQKSNSRMLCSSFQPAINKISDILMRQQRQNETLGQKLARLTSKCQKQDKINQIQRQLYQECTFEPNINMISKCLAAEHVPHRCDHMPKEEIFQFRPKINKTSEMIVKNSLNRSQSIGQFEQEKKLQKLKMQSQYQELRQCTFKPKINNKTSLSSCLSVTNIRGFDKFSKKVEKITQLKQEQQERQQKLFSMEKQYKNRKSTKPHEFKLSQGYNLKEAVKQELSQKFQKECTFQPHLISFR